MSPVQRRTKALRADLAALEHEHKMQRLCKTACEEALTNSNGGNPDATLQYRKRGSRQWRGPLGELAVLVDVEQQQIPVKPPTRRLLQAVDYGAQREHAVLRVAVDNLVSNPLHGALLR
jgi:hypothetical protein